MPGIAPSLAAERSAHGAPRVADRKCSKPEPSEQSTPPAVAEPASREKAQRQHGRSNGDAHERSLLSRLGTAARDPKKEADAHHQAEQQDESAEARSAPGKDRPPSSTGPREDQAVGPLPSRRGVATAATEDQRYPIGSTGPPPTRTSKWTWSPRQCPVHPTAAMVWPCATDCPIETEMLELCA
jgi:hypothetical protein